MLLIFFTRKLVNVSTLNEFKIVTNKYSFSADELDLLLFATRPVVENMHSMGTKVQK